MADASQHTRKLQDLLERLRAVPVIFLSVACSLDERVKGLQVGGDDFIRKPYEPTELIGLVRAHLKRAAFLQRLNRSRSRSAYKELR